MIEKATALLVALGAFGCDVEHVRLLSGRSEPVATPGSPLECEQFGDWLAPELVTDLGLPEENHFGPSLTKDPAVLFYSMGAGADEDIWRANRDSPGGDFSGAAPVLELNTGDMDGAPYITPDGRTLWFATTRSGGLGDRDIWKAEGGVNGFSAPVNVSEVNSETLDHLPTLSADGLILMFGSHRDGSGHEHLFMTTRASPSAAFDEPAPVTELNTDGYNGSPAISGDGLSLLFASGRAGGSGNDLYLATRAARDEPFGQPLLIAELSSPDNDEDPRLSPSGDEIFFASDRDGDVYRIWHALRECLDP